MKRQQHLRLICPILLYMFLSLVLSNNLLFAQRLVLTDLYINSRPVAVGDTLNNRVLLKESIEYSQELHLKYTENNFTIVFSDNADNILPSNQYRYKLEGFESYWNTSAIHHKARYTNIQEGNYVLKIQVANADHAWGDKTMSLPIRIAPPFSRSPTAYIIYIVLAGIIGWIIYKTSRTFQLKKEAQFALQLEKENTEKLLQYKSQLLTNISHEFHTPLTLISAPLAHVVGQSKLLADKQMFNNLKQVQQHVDMLTRWFNQLISFHKIETGQVQVHRIPVNLQTYLKHIYDSFVPLAKHQRIQFNYYFDKTDCWAEIDTKLYDQVLFNLLSNAFKRIPENNRVSLKLKTGDEPSTLNISIEKTGSSIHSKDTRYLLDNDFQSQTNQFKGTGINLACTKEIVELHGGEILLKNTEGQGIIYTIIQSKIVKPQKATHKTNYTVQSQAIDIHSTNDFLKQNTSELESFVEKQEKANTIDVYKSQANTPEQTKTPLPILLIVEENLELRVKLGKYLSPYYTIHLAKNGKEGMAIAKVRHPHAIVTDIALPIMDGIEMMNRIKDQEEISHIPFLVLSEKDTVENQLDSFNTAADNYLEKPFTSQLVHERITAMIQNRQIQKRHFQEEITFKPELVCTTNTDMAFLTKIVEIIHVHMDNSNFTVETLAHAYGVSRIYLNKKIKALTDQTPTQFIRSIRLKQATQLIVADNLNISEVAWAVGYNDVSTFRSRFKTEFGMTPTAYKKESNKQALSITH